MIPLIGIALSALADRGLTLISDAIVAKGKDVVEKTLGMKIPEKTEEFTPEVTAQLKMRMMENEEKLLELSIKKEELGLESEKLSVQNTNSARDMNSKIQESANASKLAKDTPYYLDILIVLSTIGLGAVILFKAIPEGNTEIVYTMFGSLFTMSMTVLNFHRGSSASSKSKDDAIHNLSKGE